MQQRYDYRWESESKKSRRRKEGKLAGLGGEKTMNRKLMKVK